MAACPLNHGIELFRSTARADYRMSWCREQCAKRESRFGPTPRSPLISPFEISLWVTIRQGRPWLTEANGSRSACHHEASHLFRARRFHEPAGEPAHKQANCHADRRHVEEAPIGIEAQERCRQSAGRRPQERPDCGCSAAQQPKQKNPQDRTRDEAAHSCVSDSEFSEVSGK